LKAVDLPTPRSTKREFANPPSFVWSTAMHFLLLIYAAERDWSNLSAEEQLASRVEYGKLSQSLQQTGTYVGGNRLENIVTAKTVRVRNGKVQHTDGPFAETREQLGGYYLVDVDTIEDAMAIAERIPAARLGSVEVRPVAKIPPMPPVDSAAARSTTA
jgi:hypothetical protein